MKKKTKKKVIKHLKDDIKMYRKEETEDRELMDMLRREMMEARKHAGNPQAKKNKPHLSAKDRKLIKVGKKEDKIADVMEEFKKGTLHSGSKKGPKVKKRKQAIAIALSEARRMKKKKKR